MAVIIGGGIGILPSLVLVFVERWKQHSQQKFEWRIKQLELYDIPRRTAIKRYMECLGALMATGYRQGALQEYFSAYEEASLYVSKGTRELMLETNGLVNDTWVMTTPGVRSEPFTMNPQIEKLNDALYGEMVLIHDYEKNPSHRRTKENRKKDASGDKL